MARRYASNDSAARAFIASLVADGTYSDKTILHYRQHVALIARRLGAQSLYDMTPDDVRALARDFAADGLAVSTQRDYMHALRSLLKFVGNPSYDTRILYQADTRPRVDWLAPDQARALMDSPLLTPTERLIVVLMLGMGLRRVEVARLRITDVDEPHECITVIGKGRAGGKLRAVPFHPRFAAAYRDWLAVRRAITAHARDDPATVLIWPSRNGRACSPYNAVKGSGLDGVIRRASVRVGVHFSAHTLRRTFGRIMWLSGVPVVTIARILGHSSTEQTLSYIGANLDDMRGAMAAFALQ